MRSKGLDPPVLVPEWFSRLVSFRHVLGVAMVGGQYKNATHLFNGIDDDLEDINRQFSKQRKLDHMCVLCMVTYQSINQLVGNLRKIREVIAHITHSCTCTLTASSAALHPTTVASMSPVWPTISPFAMLTRTYKMPLSVPALSVHYFFVLRQLFKMI